MVRVSKLAKDLGVQSSFLIKECQEKGLVHIKHHANSLTEEQEVLLRSQLGESSVKKVSVKEEHSPETNKVDSKEKDEKNIKPIPSATESKERRHIPLW